MNELLELANTIVQGRINQINSYNYIYDGTRCGTCGKTVKVRRFLTKHKNTHYKCYDCDVKELEGDINGL